MKRIASFILCLAMLATYISQLAVSSLAEEPPTITCSSKGCNPGDIVSIEVNLSNNPGIMYLEITPTYSAELGSPSVQNGSIMSDLTKGKQYIWTADEDVSANGNLLTMTFSVDESVAPGNYTVGFIFRSAYNYAEKSVAFTVEFATVTVKAKPVPVTGIALDKETASIGTSDGTLTLTPIFTPETATNKNVTWASSDTSVATVNGGIVTPLKKGTAIITTTTEDGNFSASCIVTVSCSHLNTTDIPAKDSTCIAHGHAAYKTCNDCGKVVEGSNAELPLGKHTGGKATCKQKAICSVCGNEYGDLAKHIYTEAVDGKYLVSDATCGSKAVYNKSCSVCGAKSDETFETGEYDYTNHIGSTYKKNQKEATCYAEGYTGDIYCSTCNHEIEKGTPIAKNAHNPASVWTTDETDHWKECQTVGCGNIIDKAHHSGGEATCVKKAICSVCKVEYGAVDPSNHKHTEVRGAKDATCYAEGYTGDTWCTDCNKEISKGIKTERLPHRQKLIAAKEATVVENGNIEYYCCDGCGKYFADAEGKNEITLDKTVIKKLPPEITEGNNAVVIKGDKTPLTFCSNALFADFIRAELDGEKLDEKSYTKAEGSIIVTLNPDFVSTLPIGEHTIGIVSESGTAAARFTVKASDAPIDPHGAGDINGDGVINTADLVRLMKYIAGSDVVAYYPDVNGDGRVTVADLVRLMKYIAGQDVELHPSYPSAD